MDHMGAGRIGNAIVDLRKAVELMPDFVDAYRELGGIYKTTGQYEEALPQYIEVVRIQPDDAESRFALGLVYDRLAAERGHQRVPRGDQDDARVCRSVLLHR